MKQYKEKSRININIGNNIKKIRESVNLKQEAFANEINKFLKREFLIETNYDYKTISNWEQGNSIPKIEVLIGIAKHYNFSLDEILTEEIKDVISKSSFSNSEETLLNDFIKNPNVCLNKNGKLVSAFNSELYKYGQLSYLADNLVDYRAELSKNFSFTNSTKEVQIIVGIMDINDGKRELHYLGSGEDDIVSIENIPTNFYTNCDVKRNNVIDSIMYNEILHQGFKHVIKLGNGKIYYIDENCSEYNHMDYKFVEGNIPSDLDFYEINKDDDWTDYACLKGHNIIDDNELFDFEGSGIYYYKKAGIFEIVLFGKIKCTDAQLVKVLSDDYKYRLIKTLSQISDDSTCEFYKKEVNNYERKK